MKKHDKSDKRERHHFAVTCARVPEARPIASTQFPPPPVTPGALISLELLLSNPVVDLAAIAQVIRDDIGLTLEVFRLSTAVGARPACEASLLDVKTLVLLTGIDGLKALTQNASLFPGEHPSDFQVRSFRGYSTLARRTAMIAERLARRDWSTPSEDAYAAGLVWTLGTLPSILGWNIPELSRLNHHKIGELIAKSWGLPPVLVDVVRGDRRVCPGFSRILLDLASRAHVYALAADTEFKPEAVALCF